VSRDAWNQPGAGRATHLFAGCVALLSIQGEIPFFKEKHDEDHDDLYRRFSGHYSLVYIAEFCRPDFSVRIEVCIGWGGAVLYEWHSSLPSAGGQSM
jgi:hypothetical protein